MDIETRNYLSRHAMSIAAKAAEGDLLSRRILSLFFAYRAGKSDRAQLDLLRSSVQIYKNRVAKEMGKVNA